MRAKRYLLSTVSSLAILGAVPITMPAMAADMPVKARPMPAPVLSWTGPYIGLQGGYVSHEGEFETTNGFLGGDPAVTRTFDRTEGGVFGGGHLGYNWQAGRWVFGVEGDLNALSARAKIDSFPPFASYVTFDVKWLATARARVGVLLSDAMLIYLTGGIAFADVRNVASPTAFGIRMIEDRVKTGWTVGGGIEHVFARNWTVRVEGRYVDLGDKSVRCTPASDTDCNAAPYRGEFSNTLLMGLVGVSLKF
jgi:outer membrane immunogenic protein